MKERLQKALARAGVASRREIERMILDGKVWVDGHTVRELGLQIDVEEADVRIEGRRVSLVTAQAQEKLYFLLNKPLHVLTTCRDERGRKTVMDLIKGGKEGRVFPVGRLDFDAEGAVLLTNDGELAHQLMHPKFHVPKTYWVKIKGVPADEELDKLRRGVYLEDGPTGPSHIEIIEKLRANTWVEVILTQGKNRQIKRMFWRIKHPVIKLIRTHFAGIPLGNLGPGAYRELTRRELEHLKEFAAS